MDLDELFSYRNGQNSFEELEKTEELNTRTRKRIWNICHVVLDSDDSRTRSVSSFKTRAFHRWFCDYLGSARDEIDTYWKNNLQILKNFILKSEWYSVFDTLEIFLKLEEITDRPEIFKESINRIFEEEKYGYRVVGTKITEITDEIESEEVEQALQSPLAPVKDHLAQALVHFSNRESPDYRNAVNEAISAVEAICQRITGDDDTSLGDALDTIQSEGSLDIHGALIESFSSMYGYTSQYGGIRHAISEGDDDVAHADAKYAIVTCSAFVNYLIEKSERAGIDLTAESR